MFRILGSISRRRFEASSSASASFRADVFVFSTHDYRGVSSLFVIAGFLGQLEFFISLCKRNLRLSSKHTQDGDEDFGVEEVKKATC
jgi:hypothetical protein